MGKGAGQIDEEVTANRQPSTSRLTVQEARQVELQLKFKSDAAERDIRRALEMRRLRMMLELSQDKRITMQLMADIAREKEARTAASE